MVNLSYTIAEKGIVSSREHLAGNILRAWLENAPAVAPDAYSPSTISASMGVPALVSAFSADTNFIPPTVAGTAGAGARRRIQSEQLVQPTLWACDGSIRDGAVDHLPVIMARPPRSTRFAPRRLGTLFLPSGGLGESDPHPIFRYATKLVVAGVAHVPSSRSGCWRFWQSMHSVE